MRRAMGRQFGLRMAWGGYLFRRARLRAYTLIELITVIAIIGIILGAILPGASRMWAQRNEAGAANMIRGLLLSARSQAIRNGERGLFFYADEHGHQFIVFIEADPPGLSPGDQDTVDCVGNGQPVGCVTNLETVNRFRVMPGKVYKLPPPYRATALWALDKPLPPVSTVWPTWPQQLSSQRFPINVSGLDTPRYHRSYFTVIFNSRGELVPNRDVLIHDSDTDNNGLGDGFGDSTRLVVGSVVTDAWYQSGAVSPSPIGFQTTGGDSRAELYDMVVLGDGRAANFKSVDGLVVYDDSSLDGLLAIDRRKLIAMDGQPVYVNRYTGEVIFGPRGE